jgi:hypothetical protein
VYKFSTNQNIPAYLFMCVITSMFFGLMGSSEEIVKDRKLLKRESFLNLSWFSYLNSKIMMMFMISAFQTFSFIIIGNLVLEIRDMTFSYWLVLFTTSCFANVLGLNISSAFNSVITIYIIIPFIIIPQLLFSGVLVKFDQLHKGRYASQEYVPVIGDLMTARWAFEALAVRQFKDNEYSKHFFNSNAFARQNSYYALLVDELAKDLYKCRICSDSAGTSKNHPYYRDLLHKKLKRLNLHINELSDLSLIAPGTWKSSLTVTDFNKDLAKETRKHLDSLKKYFNGKMSEGIAWKNSDESKLDSAIGKEELIKLRDNYENESLMSMVLDEENPRKVIYTSEKLIQKMNPGYMKPTSVTGRSHFFAPVKLLGKMETDTYIFNLSVIWLVTILLYVALYFKVLQKFITIFGNMRMKRPE